MILGIGVDVAQVDRFRDLKESMLNRILSPEELVYVEKYRDPAPHIAGFWAAKEALVKAMNRKTLTFSNLSILHHPDGRPYFNYLPKKGRLHLSITHEKAYAVSMVVWEDV